MSSTGLDRVNVHWIVYKVTMHRNPLPSAFHSFQVLLCTPPPPFSFSLPWIGLVKQWKWHWLRIPCTIAKICVTFVTIVILCSFPCLWYHVVLSGTQVFKPGERKCWRREALILSQTRRNSGIESLSARLLQNCQTITRHSLCESYSWGYHISAVHSELKPINPWCLDSVTK